MGKRNMENNYYLSIGTKLGGHYEIEKVLSEDEFEILYLAKDLHKRGEYVVLKELFLKSYSQREGNDVVSPAKSKIVFEETKKEVIKEVNTILNNASEKEVAIYGTFEENNTVYTIMEFINDANLNGYLNVNPIKDEEEIKKIDSQKIKKDVMEEKIIEPRSKEKPKSSLFLKLLITMLLICIALGYYAYDMIKSDKEKRKNRPTVSAVVEKIKKVEKEESSSNLPSTKEELINDYVEGSNNIKEEQDEEATPSTPKGAAYISDVEAYKREQAAKKAKEEAKRRALENEERLRQEKEKALRKKALEEKALEEKALEDEEERLREEEYKRLEEEAKRAKEAKNREFVPDNIREFIGEEEVERSNHPENDFPSSNDNIEENLPLGAVNPNNNLGTPINSTKSSSLGKKIKQGYVKTPQPKTIDKQAIKEFLNNFIRISGNGSIDEILSNYDDDVERYFSLRNVNQDTIRRDKINYHNKWTHRRFKLVDFDITKVYNNGNERFYDIKTTTNWNVSNDAGKSISGTSNGMMTLRETNDGFKVTSIYTTKSK
jgi:hypothetical protein